jgi:hypothetical protein
MSVAERRAFVDALPVSVTPEEREAEEEEGDDHRETCSGAVDALRSFWERTGRRAYVSSTAGGGAAARGGGASARGRGEARREAAEAELARLRAMMGKKAPRRKT